MSRHLKNWINDAELQRRDGRYTGIIANVVEEEVRNRYTARREVQPVVEFDDGWRIIPNLSMRRALIEIFGTPETTRWIGRRIVIFRRRVERTDRASGEIRERFEKAVMCSDAHAREPISRTWSPVDVSSNGDEPLQPVSEPLAAVEAFEKRARR